MSLKVFLAVALGAIAFSCIAVQEIEAQYYPYYMPYYHMPSYGYDDEYYGAGHDDHDQELPSVKASGESKVEDKEPPTARSVMKVWAPWSYAVPVGRGRGRFNVNSKHSG